MIKLLAERYIYPMPTVEEVVKAGYAASYHEQIKRERDAFIARFDSDPTFRAEAIAEFVKRKREKREKTLRRDGGEE